MNDAIKYVENEITSAKAKINTMEAELGSLRKKVEEAETVLQIHTDTYADIKKSRIDAGIMGVFNANIDAADPTEVSMTADKLNNDLRVLKDRSQAYSAYNPNLYKINEVLGEIREACAKAQVQLNNSNRDQRDMEPLTPQVSHFFDIKANEPAEDVSQEQVTERMEEPSLTTSSISLDSINPMLFGEENNEKNVQEKTDEPVDIFDGLINPFANENMSNQDSDPFAALHELDKTTSQPVITEPKHRGLKVVNIENAIFRNQSSEENQGRGLSRVA